MKNVFGNGLTKLVVVLVLLVSVGIVAGIAVNIDNGSNSGEPGNVENGGGKISVRDDSNEEKPEASRAEPKGATESSAAEGDTVEQSSDNYWSRSNRGNANASTNNVMANNNGATMSDSIAISDDTGSNKSGSVIDGVTETDAERAAREEAERLAEMEKIKENPSVWNPISEVENTYYWQDKCPERVVPEVSVYGGKVLSGYICESTSYVAWKAYEAYDGLVINWGNANSWDYMAVTLNYEVNKTPQIGAIGQIKNDAYGHVFWVEDVYPDGSILVTEYNNSWATYVYSGDMHINDFGARVISASEAAQYNYIILDS